LSHLKAQFMSWLQAHGRNYITAEEFEARFDAWRENHNFIQTHNSLSKTSTVGHNQFSDRTDEEMKALNGFVNTKKFDRSSRVYSKLPKTTVDSIDWVELGAVTGVKNQKSCGSCWSFSATGAMEGAHQIKTGDLVSLSEQQLVNCSHKQGNLGCMGGMMDGAFRYAENNMMETEESYPYQGWTLDNACLADSSLGVVSVSGFTDVTPMDSDALLAAIAQQPVSVAIEADQKAFQFYQSGIITENCGTNLDHGVLAVGFGVDNGTQFIKIKNSWDTTWGEDGYVRIAVTDGAGMCGVNSQPSFPATN